MRKLIAFVLGVSCTLLSCKDDVTGGGSSIVFPDSNVSFTQHVQPLFHERCTASGCHSGGAPQAGLNLVPPSYNSLMNHTPRLVVAGESNNSLLIQRLDGRIQPRMPFNQEPLTQNQLTGVRKWIDEGAQNN
ncbi:MAG: hypothetical protein ACRDGA_10470 [Bacteroidota bacterium]